MASKSTFKSGVVQKHPVVEFDKVRQSWENDFLSRPSWCDAALALTFIESCHQKITGILKFINDELLPNKTLQEKLKVTDRLKPPDVAKTLANGCFGFTRKFMKWPLDLIVGGINRSKDGKIKNASAYQTVLLLGSPGDVYGRALAIHNDSLQKSPVLWTKASAEDVLIKWQREMIRYIERKKADNTTAEEYKNMHVFAQTSTGDLLEKYSKVNLHILFIGYGIMVVYATLSLNSCADGCVSSSIALGIAGCLLVTLSSIAGLGASVFLGIPCSVASFQVLPFLTLGVGVDDMFLLVHNYDEIMHQRLPGNQLGVLLKETGLAAFFTSFCNILAFLCGSLLPVPAVRQFCLQTSLILTFNAVTILTLYPAIMCLDMKRRNANLVDCLCCIRRKIGDGTAVPPDDFSKKMSKLEMVLSLTQCVNHSFSKLLQKRCIKVLLILAHVATLCLSMYGISKLKIGLEFTDAIPKNTTAYSFARARQLYFTYFPFHIVLKGPMDFAKKQHLAKMLRHELSKIPYVVRFNGSETSDPFWLEMMEDWLKNLQLAFDTHWDVTFNKTAVIGKVDLKNNTGLGEAVLAYKLLCNVGERLDCRKADSRRLFDKSGVISVKNFYKYLSAWISLDPVSYSISRATMHPTPTWTGLNQELTGNFSVDEGKAWLPTSSELEYSQIHFSLINLTDTEAIVDMIFQVRNVCDFFTMRGLPSYPEGLPFLFWDHYIYLRGTLYAALCIIVVVIFMIISVLLCNPSVGIIMINVMIKLIIELVGFMYFVDVHLNAVCSIIIIAALGIGVEFTVHMLISFLTVMGTKNERMAMTLSHMFVPVFNGGISTMLGIIMLAFSEFDFIVKYIFMPLFLLIVLGLWNGLIFLPVLLSIVGPASEVNFAHTSHIVNHLN